MHNRARMVAASFLVKDLGIDWREGARHFFDLLLDGDVAQNVGNWQWVAGTGRRHAAEPRLQPDRAAAEARPGGRLRAALRAGARRRAGARTSPSRACWRRRIRGRSSTTRGRSRRSGSAGGWASLSGVIGTATSAAGGRRRSRTSRTRTSARGPGYPEDAVRWLAGAARATSSTSAPARAS